MGLVQMGEVQMGEVHMGIVQLDSPNEGGPVQAMTSIDDVRL